MAPASSIYCLSRLVTGSPHLPCLGRTNARQQQDHQTHEMPQLRLHAGERLRLNTLTPRVCMTLNSRPTNASTEHGSQTGYGIREVSHSQPYERQHLRRLTPSSICFCCKCPRPSRRRRCQAVLAYGPSPPTSPESPGYPPHPSWR